MSSWYFLITDDDREWMRRYPGSFKARLSKRDACFICGKPGYVVPAPPAPMTIFEYDAMPDAPITRTGTCCPGHEYAVRRALYHHPEFDHLTGRPRA